MPDTITKETEYSYEIAMDTAYLDKDGNLRPDSYAAIATRIMDWHTTNIGFGNPDLMEKFGIAWALLSMEIHVHGNVKRGEILRGVTWCPRSKTGIHDRDLILTNEDGKDIITIGSMWTLIDVEKRSMYKGSDALSLFPPAERESVCPKKKLRFKDKDLDLTEVDKLIVLPGWIDGSGHMNNSRYGEIAYNHMGKELRDRMGSIKKLEFYYQGEMKEGDEMTVYKQVVDDGIIFVCDKKGDSLDYVARITW